MTGMLATIRRGDFCEYTSLPAFKIHFSRQVPAFRTIKINVQWSFITAINTRPAINTIRLTNSLAPGRIQDCCNGSILSRYTKEDGTIGFTINTRPGLGQATGDNDEVDIDLAQIYEYVTPEELERYENHDWELEDERERNRPKLGRPRKTQQPPADMSNLTGTLMPKRSRGRPRKGPNKRQFGINAGAASVFAGVHVASPVKAGEATSTYPTSATRRLSPMVQFTREPTTSSMEDVLESNTRDSDIQVDQITPSNANKVVGAKVPEPSPSRRHKASYSMVQAALGESESSDLDAVETNTDSEDELCWAPTTQQHRSSQGVLPDNSITAKEGGHESLFVTPAGSISAQSQNGRPISTAPAEDQSLFGGGIDSSSDDAMDLLEQFQASKTRRVQSNSPTSSSFNVQPANPLEKYLEPQSPAESSAIPAKPQHQPAVSSENHSLQRGFIYGLKRVVSNTFGHQTAVPPPSKSFEPHQYRAVGTISSSSANSTLNNKSVDPLQAARKRQTQLPWGSANPRPTTSAVPDINKKSTPPKPPRPRHSMTPHFPSPKRTRLNPTSPSLRGGFSNPAPILRTSRPQHRTSLTSPPAHETPLPTDHQFQPLLNGRPKPSVAAEEIILGDLETSSEEYDHHSPSKEPINRLASGIGRELHETSDREITLGSPVLSTSSEEALKPKVTKPASLDRISSPSYTKKRRRSSSESGKGGLGSWYRMVRR
ncbi:MAG: hypothetical protein Q9216_002356 [Gyalolechia sp. 2 TL-2023]